MSRRDSSDPRQDRSLSCVVDAGLRIVQAEGVGPAIDFMENHGVPRPIIFRVLASPRHVRARERRCRQH